MALSKDLLIARAAFEESTRQRPTNRITLRNGAHVIQEFRPVKVEG